MQRRRTGYISLSCPLRRQAIGEGTDDGVMDTVLCP